MNLSHEQGMRQTVAALNMGERHGRRKEDEER
jgi:hypothetical protein